MQGDVLGVARHFADKVLPATSGGGAPGESASLSAVRHIFGGESVIGLSYTNDLTIPATAPFVATPTVWANHFLASAMFWYRLESGLMIFRQVAKDNSKWLVTAVYYFDLLGNAKLTLAMFNYMHVAFAEGQKAKGWLAKLAAWAKLRMAYFTIHYLFAKSNAGLIAIQSILHPPTADYVEKLTDNWAKPFEGLAAQMKKMLGDWYTAWGKVLGLSPEKAAEHIDSFGVWKGGEDLQASSYRWALHMSLWAFQHWEFAADLGTWATLSDGKAWDAAKWHKILELRYTKWFGATGKLIAFTHLAPASWPVITYLRFLVPWQGMYLSYVGSAIAFHNSMAAKGAGAVAFPQEQHETQEKHDKIL
jgi:hypothetical protein